MGPEPGRHYDLIFCPKDLRKPPALMRFNLERIFLLEIINSEVILNIVYGLVWLL
jgi:hypothetical protein